MIGSTRPLALPSGTSWDPRFVEYVSLLKRSNALIAVRGDDRICMTVWKWGAGALGSKLVNLCSANTGGAALTKEADASYRYVDGSWFIERRAY
jgi:hypothetical protein